MEKLTYIIVGFIIIGWIIGLFKNKVSALVFILFNLTIYYPNFTIGLDVDFILKCLLLITALYYIKLYGFKKHTIKIIVITIILYFISMINADWNENYTRFASLTAFFSLILGILLYSVAWPTKYRMDLLKSISKLPLISIALGLILSSIGLLDFFGRNGTGIAGASLATNLSFFGVVGIMASLYLKIKIESDLYRGLAYVNFLITALTLTRGGLLAAIIVLLPEIIDFTKSLFKKKKYFIIFLISVVVMIYPVNYIYHNILERTFINGQVNTSGRTEAWMYIITLSTNKWIGNGYGFLKTVTDSNLKAFTAAHNEYIRLYVETGYLGIGIIISVFSMIFNKLIKENKFKGRILIITLLLSFMIYSYTDNTMTNFRFWIPFMITLGLIDNNSEIIKFKL